MDREILSVETAKKVAIYDINADYKKRIDEAIDYIDCINGGKICSQFNPYLDNLLKILKGDTDGSNK